MANPSEGSRGARCIVFHGGKRIAEGTQAEVTTLLGATTGILVFDLETSEQIELHVPGAASASNPATVESAARLPRPGRPKLGVIPREVTLLPPDWEWLNAQPGGASVTLRKLVLRARRASAGADRIREAQAICYRFIHAIAGNEAGFEQASRALFAGSVERFARCVASWPADVRAHAMQLAQAGCEPSSQRPSEHSPMGQSAL